MLGYTISVLKDTLHAIKKIGYIIDVLIQIIYIGYLVFSLIFQFGSFVAKSIILSISLLYFIYFLVTTKKWYTKEEKYKRKKVKLISKITKKSVNLIVIILAIVELCIHPSDKDSISILLTSLMIFGFVFSLIFDLIIGIIDKRIKLLESALQQDLQDIKHYVNPINVLKRAVGKDKRSVAVDDNTFETLEKIKDNQKVLKKKKKLWKKETKEKEKLLIEQR